MVPFTWTFFRGESTSIYPCWTFPNGPKGLGGVVAVGVGGNESQGELIATKPWGAEIGEGRREFFFSQRWWSLTEMFFFLVGHNGCDECFSPCNLFGIFSGDISWGCFGRGGNPARPSGFPQEPNAGGSSETSEVSRLDMFLLSPPSCDVFFCCSGWGGIFFSC